MARAKQQLEKLPNRNKGEHKVKLKFRRLQGMLADDAPVEQRGNNLLNLRFISSLVHSRAFPSALRWLNLMVLLGLIYFAWGATEESLRYTNLSSWVVWVIWWPFVVGATFLAGRLWCTMCHLRLISDWFSAIGFKLTPPKWFERHGSSVTLAMVLGLIILHSSVVSYGVNHIPHYTALYLAILMAYAITVSLVFKKGTFCKLFCPLVSFFGPYSQLSPTELRSNNLGTCLKCGSNQKKKMCLRSCTNDMMMQMRLSNENCLLCFQCVKHCPNKNIRFSLRGYLTDLWQNTNRSWASILAGAIILGIIFQELGEEWKGFEALTLAVPAWLSGIGIPDTILGGYIWLETLWVNLIMPMALLGAAGFIAWALTRRGSILNYVKLYGVALLPLVFSAHLSKLIKKFNDKLGYAAHVFSDPFGRETAEAINAGTIAKPGPFFVSTNTMGWVLLAVVACGIFASIYASIRIARRAYPQAAGTATITSTPFIALYLACGLGFLMTIWHWLIV